MSSCLTFTLVLLHSLNKFKLLIYSLGTLLLFNYYFGFFDYYNQKSFAKEFVWWQPDFSVELADLDSNCGEESSGDPGIYLIFKEGGNDTDYLTRYSFPKFYSAPTSDSYKYPPLDDSSTSPFILAKPVIINSLNTTSLYSNSTNRNLEIKNVFISRNTGVLLESHHRDYNNNDNSNEGTKNPAIFELTLLVKSSRDNVDRRNVIRSTWGNRSVLTFPGGDKLVIRSVFILGLYERELNSYGDNVSISSAGNLNVTTNRSKVFGSYPSSLPSIMSFKHMDYSSSDKTAPITATTQSLIQDDRTDDLIFGYFLDHYYNNTLKVLLGLKWYFSSRIYEGVKFWPGVREKLRYHHKRGLADCRNTYKRRSKQTPPFIDSNAHKFVVLIDDDYYLSPSHLYNYIRHNLTKDSRFFKPSSASSDVGQNQQARSQSVSGSFRNVYCGHVFNSNTPHRLRSSKWFVGLETYPYDIYPPYVTGGAILLSHDVARYFYEMASITKTFVFDDIYLAILALKLKKCPVHNPDFVLFPTYNPEIDLKDKIASHGYSDPKELLKIWRLLNPVLPISNKQIYPTTGK
ncbi:uncharacterized protein LOC135931253 [Gordionus sp. m RMFG-2023]|uniref:uncharacterized protein LOC135931253 n=1 Tax=Gordionus sp. m RMFG-2023 TaxID=3053472 RepID=UPI0031FC1BA9